MPIYEYQCQHCGHHMEVMQKISEAPLKECPACHKATLEKLISVSAFQLKGTGWYATDFRDKDKTTSAKPNEATEKSATNQEGASTAQSAASAEANVTEKTEKKPTQSN